MKYISADKLIAEIERRIEETKSMKPAFDQFWAGQISDFKGVKTIITSLQQEQPQLPGIEDPGIPGKDFIPVEWVDACEMYGKWKIVKQEQLEVDLEKFTEKIKTFQGRYKYPEILSIKGAMAFMARMFYQYPNIARQWYDSLPKTTMD